MPKTWNTARTKKKEAERQRYSQRRSKLRLLCKIFGEDEESEQAEPVEQEPVELGVSHGDS